jgi:putative ABC transport system ATP-binding protein
MARALRGGGGGERAVVTLLEVRSLARTFPADGEPVRAVDGVDLAVAAGEFVSVMGPSGCGKSTLLHLCAGLDRPTAGEIHVDGARVDDRGEAAWARLRRDRLGVVFQAYNLVDDLTVRENLVLSAVVAGVARGDARRRADDLLDRLGVTERAAAVPSRLSGGQQQRVALARALVNRPALLLADEPTGALDSTATGEVLGLLQELHAEGQAILVVTHDPRVAAAAERLVSMRDGRIVDDTRLDGGVAFPATLADLRGG